MLVENASAPAPVSGTPALAEAADVLRAPLRGQADAPAGPVANRSQDGLRTLVPQQEPRTADAPAGLVANPSQNGLLPLASEPDPLTANAPAGPVADPSQHGVRARVCKQEPLTPDAQLDPLPKSGSLVAVATPPASAAPREMASSTEDRQLAVRDELRLPVVVAAGSQNPHEAIRGDAGEHVQANPRKERASLPTLKASAIQSRISPTDSPVEPTGQPRPQAPEAPRQLPPALEQIATGIIARAEVVTREGRTDFHIRLEPAELGTVRVHLIASEQTLSARLLVHDEAAHQLLASQVQSLRQSLEQLGVSLGRCDVLRGGTGSPDTWQQPQQQRPEPVPEYPSPDLVRPKQAVPGFNPVPATPGRIDVVA